MRKMLLLLITISLFGLSGCLSIKKAYEQGRYEKAVYIAAGKLQKGKVKAKHMLYFEDAYNKQLNGDLDRIDWLKKQGDPNCWVEIHAIYGNIRHRQNLVKPHLPVFIEKEFRNLNIPIIDIDEEMIEAKENAAAYLYESATKKLNEGSKLSARKAYFEFAKVKEYFSDYRDVDELMRQAHEQGRVYVDLFFVNNTNKLLPKEFEIGVMQLQSSTTNSQWVSYKIGDPDNSNADYDLVVNIDQMEISPEKVTEKEYAEQQSVQDGFKYVLDKDGNVMKDSLGNDIKEPKYIMVKAVIHEIYQSKAGFVAGTVEYYNPETRSLMKRVPFREDLSFNHYSSTYHGDKRALTKATLEKLGGKPLPFPSDVQMMMDGASLVNRDLEKIISDHIALVLQ